MMNFGITTVAMITVLCYLCGELVKVTSIDNKWVPVFCGILGGILGVVGLYTMADFPATDILSAIAVGIASGLAATGINQITKQLGGNGNAGR